MPSHRARLFPLPSMQPVVRPPGSSSAHKHRFRFRLQCVTQGVTLNLIRTLNQLYANPASLSHHRSCPHSHSPLSQPETPSFCFHCSSLVSVPAPPSIAQLRIVAALQQQCASYVEKVRAWSPSAPERAISASVLDLLQASVRAPSLTVEPQLLRQNASSVDDLFKHADHSTALSSFSTYSSASTPVVPLIASRISLPESLTIIQVDTVLPPDLAVQYSTQPCQALLRHPADIYALNLSHPLKPPRVAGSRSEYVQLIGRLRACGMIDFTNRPRAVNGVFAVGKDELSDRLIIDAQPANRLFVDSPRVSLPGPSHLTQLQVPAGQRMFTAKSDLSNFYHHLGLPAWMQPYFALPPLSAAELRQVGASSDAAFPMCRTMPMGFSHAVFVGQSCHEHVVYRAGTLSRDDSLLQLSSPVVCQQRGLHGIIIDDFFLFSLNRELAERIFAAVLRAYADAGFVVKMSKVVWPTADPVKVIGFDIDGGAATVSLPVDSQLSLIRSTLSLIHSATVTGAAMSHVLGRWTWVMMLRRPTLAVLQHVYRFARLAHGRRFSLWRSARRELCMLLTLLPLLHARLDAPFYHRAFASDASELAAGVVSTPLSSDLHSMLWPLCSSRHHAALQPLLAGDSWPDSAPLQLLRQQYDAFYASVSASPWRVNISAAWRDASEHINVLELRAALLTLHHVLSSPSSHLRRVYLLLDSSVAFFSMWKGRSSSPSLLIVLRKISSLLLAGGLHLLLGWLPSACNPADAPSRLLSQ